MRKITFVTGSILSFTIFCISFSQYGCNQPAAEVKDSASGPKQLSNAELLSRGKYFVTTAACGDCHTPKTFTQHGPVEDSSRLLSGHPAKEPLMPIDKNALKPGNWVLIGGDLTSFVGPWGISFTANLTPDTATGIGLWTDDVFIKIMRTGKHLGQDSGRNILPAMPWNSIAHCTDEDLKAIFIYLKALPPISNKVPQPVPPNEVAKMK
jgi:hypothetical protein